MRIVRWITEGTPSARPPAGTVVYAVGDIHGRFDLFDALRHAIIEDAAQRAAMRRVVVYLGDYLSRGPESRRVVAALIDAPIAGFESIHLKGNHEDLVLRFLDGDLAAGRDWLAHGGIEALVSYGIDVPEDRRTSDADLERLRNEFGARAPAPHIDFLRSLVLSWREGGYVFVHAGLRPGIALAKQAPRDMMWIRQRFLESDEEFSFVVVHGHSIVHEPVFKPNRICLDTAAYTTGRLTALALQEEARMVLQAAA